MGTRRKSRELVLQMLFQADMGNNTADVVRKTFWAERTNVEEEARGFAGTICFAWRATGWRRSMG